MADTNCSQVLRAWTEPGPHPEFHAHMQNKLRSEWPTLAKALDRLAQQSEAPTCRTCGGVGEVARTVALPGHALATTVTRYDACPDCTENVECRTCDGTGNKYHRQTMHMAVMEYAPCPDCTSENVECQTCHGNGTAGTSADGSHIVWQRCPDCPPPENVDSPNG